MPQEIRLKFPVNTKHSFILLIHADSEQDPKYYIGQPKEESPTTYLSGSSQLRPDNTLQEVNSDHQYRFTYKLITDESTDVKRGMLYFSEVIDSNDTKHVVCALMPDDYDRDAVKVIPAFVIHDENDRLHQLCAYIYDDFRRAKHNHACDLISTIASKWSSESYFDLNLQKDQFPEEILFGLAVNRLQNQSSELLGALEDVKSMFCDAMGIENSDNQEISYADAYAWFHSQAVINTLMLQQMQNMLVDRALLARINHQLGWFNFCMQEDVRRLEEVKQNLLSERNGYGLTLLKVYEALGLVTLNEQSFVVEDQTSQFVMQAESGFSEKDDSEDYEVTVFEAITYPAPEHLQDVNLASPQEILGDDESHSVPSDQGVSVLPAQADELARPALVVELTPTGQVDELTSPARLEELTPPEQTEDKLVPARTATDIIPEQTNLEASMATSTVLVSNPADESAKQSDLQNPATTPILALVPNSDVESRNRKKKGKGKAKKQQNSNDPINPADINEEDVTSSHQPDAAVTQRMVECTKFQRMSEPFKYHQKNSKILQGLGVKTLSQTVAAIRNNAKVCEDSNLVHVDHDKPILFIQALFCILDKVFVNDRVPTDEELVLIKQLFELLIPKNCTIVDCKPELFQTPLDAVVSLLQCVMCGHSNIIEYSANFELRKSKALHLCKDLVEIIAAHGFSSGYNLESAINKQESTSWHVSPYVMFEFITILEPIMYNLIANRKITQLADDFMPLFFDKYPTGTTLYKQFEMIIWNAILNSDVQTANIAAATIRKLNCILYAYFDLLQNESEDVQTKMCAGLINVFWANDVANTVCPKIIRESVLNPDLCTPEKAITAFELILSLRLSVSEKGYRTHPALKTNPILRKNLCIDELGGILFTNLSLEKGDRDVALKCIETLSKLELHQIKANPQSDFKLTYVCLYGPTICLGITVENDPQNVENFLNVLFDFIMTLSLCSLDGQGYKVNFRKRLDKFNEYFKEYCPNQYEQLIPRIESKYSVLETDDRMKLLLAHSGIQVNGQPNTSGKELIFSGTKNVNAGDQTQGQDTNEAINKPRCNNI